MRQSKESKNKALVLKAFDTLFNRRDYAAAERFWSSNYIQHSAHIEPSPLDRSQRTSLKAEF
jgi:predicted SnoaL-like aldol condensation-catalyzing enzyme